MATTYHCGCARSACSRSFSVAAETYWLLNDAATESRGVFTCNGAEFFVTLSHRIIKVTQKARKAQKFLLRMR